MYLKNSVVDQGYFSRSQIRFFFHPGFRIRIFRIPDPGPRIRIKKFKYFHFKKWFLSTRKYDPGFSSQIPDLDPDFLFFREPWSMGQKGSGSVTLLKKVISRKTFITKFHIFKLTAKLGEFGSICQMHRYICGSGSGYKMSWIRNVSSLYGILQVTSSRAALSSDTTSTLGVFRILMELIIF